MSNSHDVPVLTTERLILRGHTRDDFRHFAALCGDAEVTRHISGTPSTPAESCYFFALSSQCWNLSTFQGTQVD